MAVYNLSNEPKKAKKSQREKNKITGITLVAVSTVVFFILLTNIIPFLKSFLLGVFGLFSYPLFITAFVIGVALINNKKYVMTTKYIVYLSCAILSLLCILHLLFIDTSGKFFEYLGRCYAQKMTVGGIMCGILTAPIVFILNKAGAYILFSISLIIFGALLADYIYYLNRSQILKKPITITNVVPSVEPVLLPKREKEIEKEQPKEKVNIVLDAKVENEPEEDIARRKLGLIKSNYISEEQQSEQKPKFSDAASLKAYLLTQKNETVNMDKYKGQKPTLTPTMRNVISETKISDPIIHPVLSKQPDVVLHESEDIGDNDDTIVDRNKIFIAPIVDNQINKVIEGESNDRAFTNNESDTADIGYDKILKELSNSTKEEKSVNSSVEDKQHTFVKPKVEQQQIKEPEKEIIKPKKHLKYVYPTFDLLTTKSMDLSELNEDVMQKRTQLEESLEQFGIPAKVVNAVVGPAVTRYEIEMPAGVSVKKILSHTEDIAYNLAANGDIRIEAPIPGKSAVGIEVPNEKIATVGIRDMIVSPEFQNSKNPLTFVLGKDITGSVKLCNLAKMPHLLVAGSTGSGKSVCLNAVILSLIYKTSPDDVRLILIDPKQVEFSIYNGLPHLLVPNVITESDKALNSLTWAVDEMERRYTMFRNSRTKDIGEYNSSSDVLEGKVDKMPYIVIIIDEVADLFMTSKKEVEEKIARLAQKSRAAGIHLILATQRPSVDVITGTMKNNFPSRISFKLMSFADSKTILDQAGAEKLLGRGDMLYKPNDAPEPRRIQGCFVTTQEVGNIVDFVKEKNSEYDFDASVEDFIQNPQKQDVFSQNNGETSGEGGTDPLLPQAVKCVIENGQASISMLQRRLVIGYPRAARIVDQMQEKGFISPADGSKPRAVLITMEEYEELYGDD